jgi:nicotinate phosphoribosyltransferase
MAHEMFMAGQALYPLPIHQKEMLYMWAREFQGDLGCALSDTLGRDYFLKDFTLDLAKLFDGTRQDSGDPYSYGRRIVNHYEKLGIDPKTKYIVFSDNLNIDKAIALYKYFIHNINVSFGIGTNLTNDCGDIPISIVIKMQYCKGIPVVKISDTPEKAMGRDKNYLEFMKEFVTNQTRRKRVKE